MRKKQTFEIKKIYPNNGTSTLGIPKKFGFVSGTTVLVDELKKDKKYPKGTLVVIPVGDDLADLIGID